MVRLDHARGSCIRPTTVLFGVIYCGALAAWNYFCSHAAAQHDTPRPHLRRHHGAHRFHRHQRGMRETMTQLVVDEPPAEEPAVAVASSDAAAASSDAAASSSDAAVASSDAATAAACPGRRPYHTLLTTQATTYQARQSRIMYFHWAKQKAAGGPCTEMGGFTRLVASEGGQPDGLEVEMPSVFVRQYTTAEIARYGHFGAPPQSRPERPPRARPPSPRPRAPALADPPRARAR